MKNLYLCSGEMAERSNAAVLKTVVQQCTGGSNPSFSAEMKRLESRFCSLKTKDKRQMAKEFCQICLQINDL